LRGKNAVEWNEFASTDDNRFIDFDRYKGNVFGGAVFAFYQSGFWNTVEKGRE